MLKEDNYNVTLKVQCNGETAARESQKLLDKMDEEQDFYEPVTLNIECKGAGEAREAQKLLKVLKTVRNSKELGRITDKDGKTTINLISKREHYGYKLPAFGTKKTFFPQKDGTQLVLTEYPNKIDVGITDNGTGDSRITLEQLVKLIGHLTECDPKVLYEDIKDGGERRKATMHIHKLDGETAESSMRKIHRKLSVDLIENIKEYKEKKDLYSFLDEIAHYRNLPELPRKIIDTKFIKELFLVLKQKTKSEFYPEGTDDLKIRSGSKKREVARARRVGMYVAKNALELGLTETGRIFGTFKKPKDHATVIIGTKENGKDRQFNPKAGKINSSQYPKRDKEGILVYEVEELVNDALKKFDSVHNNNNLKVKRTYSGI